MRERIAILLGILITWFAIFLIVPLMGFDIRMLVLIVSATVGGLFAGCLVMLGETVIENMILVVILLVMAGVLSGSKPDLGFIFISALLAGVIGVMTNQINQYAANKARQPDATEPHRRTQHVTDMNIDELVNSIAEDEHRTSLARWVDEWKKDDTDIHKLYTRIARWHGNVWFRDQQHQNEFWSNLHAFKENAIDGLGGLTVNERLYWFGLYEEWDNSDNKGQQRLRRKLHAPA